MKQKLPALSAMRPLWNDCAPKRKRTELASGQAEAGNTQILEGQFGLKGTLGIHGQRSLSVGAASSYHLGQGLGVREELQGHPW
jgi:hypothetical protein